MKAYANAADLTAWLGATAPADADRLLARASAVVEERVLTGYTADADGNPVDTDLQAWLRDAACAQVEFWMLVTEQHDIAGIGGNLSVEGMSHALPGTCAPRALRILDEAGLRSPVGGWRPYFRTPLELIGRAYS